MNEPTVNQEPISERLRVFGAGHVIAEQLARIATALETLAAEATERRKEQQASLIGQYLHLQATARDAASAFSSADHAAMRAAEQNRSWCQSDHEWHRRTEDEAARADAAFQAFRMAHPDVALLAEQQTAVPA